MKFVVDTNVLMTFFWKNSFSKGLLYDKNISFFSPEYALEELDRNSSEIMKKTGISAGEFKKIKMELSVLVEFIPIEEYSKFLKKASSISNKEDVDFIALALKLKIPVWSNDKDFKKQKFTKVFTTNEFIKLVSPTK
jgi:predicted nucleic acid-binding protein